MKYYHIQKIFLDVIEIIKNEAKFSHIEILLEVHDIHYDILKSQKLLCLLKIITYNLFIVIWIYP